MQFKKCNAQITKTKKLPKESYPDSLKPLNLKSLNQNHRPPKLNETGIATGDGIAVFPTISDGRKRTVTFAGLFVIPKNEENADVTCPCE